MRIAYCIHSLHLFGGIERVLSIKANYLADVYGYDIHIITADLKGRAPHFALSDKIKLHDVGVSEKFMLHVYGRRLNRILCGIRPDICVSVGGRDIFCLPSCTDGSIKVSEFHFSHEKYAVKYGGSFFGDLYARFRIGQIEKVAAKLDKFIVLTKSDKKVWESYVPNVTSIYNPLTFKSEKVAALDNRKCIAIGRLEPQKNFRDLVAAWKYVAEEYPDWVVEIYGNGGQKDALQKQIASLGLDRQVKLMGSSNDIRSKMLESSCLVMSSAYEGFPMVLLEAVETGLPMVSYDCPRGPAEIIIDGESGYLVKPGDIKGLARSVCDVISDADRRKKFGAKAKETAAQYSIDKTMEQWKQLFEDLVTK